MGRSKAWLPFGPERMLTRVTRIVGEAVSPIVVVCSRDQELPELPKGVLLAEDAYEAFGPLAGIAVGLTALSELCYAAYVTSCDVPLLSPAFVRAIADRLEGFDAVVPRDSEYLHPLAAVYRTSLGAVAHRLIANGQRRVTGLLEICRSLSIDVNYLREFDPELHSLRNANSPSEYEQALHCAGLCSGDPRDGKRAT